MIPNETWAMAFYYNIHIEGKAYLLGDNALLFELLVATDAIFS